MKKTLNLLLVAFMAINMAYSQNFYYAWEGKKVPLNTSKNGFLVEFKDESTVLDALQSYQKQNSTDKTEIVKVGKQIFLQITNEVITNKMPHTPQTFKANTQSISPLYLLPSDEKPFYFTNEIVCLPKKGVTVESLMAKFGNSELALSKVNA